LPLAPGILEALVESPDAVTSGPDQALRISTTAHGGRVFVVSLSGDLDLATAGDLMPALTGLLGHDAISVIVDVSQLEFIDSSGLNALAVGSRMIKANGGSISVAAPSDHIARIFEVVRLAEYVDVEESVDEAVRRAAATSDGEPS
jgi:anti-anti-sigma factor